MAGSDVQRFYLPLLERQVSLARGARVLDLGYYDPSAALWAARRAGYVLALRPSVDLAIDLERAGQAEGVSHLEVRLATRPNTEEVGTFDVVLLLAPFFLGNAPVREALAAAAAALKPDGALYFQVHRRRGGETHVRSASEFFGGVELVGIGGGQRRLHRATAPKTSAAMAAIGAVAQPESGRPESLHQLEWRGATVRLRLAAGVFAARGIDPGSRLLLNAVEIEPGSRILDLGCGAGTIGLALAASDPRARVVLVDNSKPAADLARENAARNGLKNVEVPLGDGYAPVGNRAFDAIVSNLPAHRGLQHDTSAAERFIFEAPKHLRRTGEAWFVANRALPYELPATRAFRQVRLAATDGRYKVLHCTEPRSSR
ncbi:MAG: methyltransferase [Chloroflexi bacterium]|nr:methyltransferase [Chloroflexota bacterium]